MRPILKTDWRYRELRAALWLWSDGRCWYCGERAHRYARTIDHVVPNKGSGWDNVRPACMSCNCRKKNKPLEVFRAQQGPFYGETESISIPPKGQPICEHPFDHPIGAASYDFFRNRLAAFDALWFGANVLPVNFVPTETGQPRLLSCW